MSRRPKTVYQRSLLLIGGLLIALGILLWWLAPRSASDRRPELADVDTDSGRLDASANAGARVRRMVGETESMMLVVRSRPEGALLVVDGQERGETPAGIDTRCSSEIPVVLELRAAGYRRWRREVPCQPGLELTFEPRLKRR